MKVRWLGWAGVEIEEQGERVVIDPLRDAGAVFRWLGERAAAIQPPEVIEASSGALAGFVTHLHRDHADAAALAAALSPGATVYEPEGYGGGVSEQLAIAQADHELSAAGLARCEVGAWSGFSVGPFSVHALPAVDGTGDPQVSWLVEAEGKRVLHLGDTMFHGWWWRFVERFGVSDVVLAPVNGARLRFPHRRPASTLPAVMDPEQAALAAELLQAEWLVPIHYGGYTFAELYEPVPDPLERVAATSSRARALELGGSIEI